MNIELISIERTERPRAVSDKKPGRQWVEIGDNNMYYEQLLELFRQSNLHRSIVLGIADRVAGEGLTVDNPERNPTDWSEINQMFPYSLLEKVALDSTIFDSFALLATTNKAGTKIVKLEHCDRSMFRPGPADENGVISQYWYSRNWKEYRKKEYTPIPYDVFDFEAPKQVGKYIIVAEPYSPGSEYVNDVTYSGAMDWIQADVEIGRYHLSNIQNGFSGLTAIVFKNGEPEGELKRRIEQKFKQKFTGASGDKIAFVYQNPGDETMEFKTLNLTEADKMYEVLSKEINQRIMFGHRVTSPVLIGIKDDVGLGNNAEELATANQMFESLVIRPRQKFVLKAIRDILRWNAVSLQVQIQPLRLFPTNDTTVEDTTQLSDDEKKKYKVLTDDDQEYLLDYLSKHGEDEADLFAAGFECVDEQDVEGDDELKIKGDKLRSIELADAFGLRPDKLSKYDVRSPTGEGFWLVRYQYALASELSPPEIIDTSRKFCRHMIEWKNTSNRVYKREVLEDLKNDEFGSYNIFWYKGSYNCRHVWKRKLYFLPKDAETNRDIRQVGNVPFVVNKLNDKRATTRNKQVQ
jgi:hypothetical protein